MNTAVTLIFPHQLFEKHPAVQPGRPVYLIEEALYFNQYRFHKKKLVLHRASMKAYSHGLEQRRFSVTYIEAQTPHAAVAQLVLLLQQKGFTEIHIAEVVDDWLHKRLVRAAAQTNIRLIAHRTPQFLNSLEETAGFFESRDTYLQTGFYIDQRKRRGLLLEGNKPLGGRWTYDEENRLKLPKGTVLPPVLLPQQNPFVSEAIRFVKTHYSTNYGNTEPPFFKRAGFYPVTHAEAEAWLDDFLQNRFLLFGAYEDAMVPEQGVLYHSVLSPLLNIGLLTPQQVLDKAFEAATAYTVPLNSLEGFVRQIVGWREYVRAMYEREGSRQRTTNFWNFTRKIPASFYTGNTGIEPIDTTIKKVLQNGYAHHIERLMLLGNFMLLCEFHPDEVYRYFMELFIDAYDWVMVPNTYGMTQFAEGGTMMTKPYISSSHYLLKMGTWKRGPWETIWDGLFWRFMQVHRPFFERPGRLGMLLESFDKLRPETKAQHLKTADDFLNNLEENGKPSSALQLTF